MKNLGEILGVKFNNAPGICTEDGKITAWPDGLGPKPTNQQINQWDKEIKDSKTLAEYDLAIENELDRQAHEAGYYHPLGRIPNIDRACSYAAFTNLYQAEGQSFVTWRAAVWDHVYKVKLAVDAGDRQPPTIEELIAELPKRVLPE
jgi:hypothetical protein